MIVSCMLIMYVWISQNACWTAWITWWWIKFMVFHFVSGNVAFMKSATQHGNYNDYSPLSAVDGGHDPIMSEGSCAHPGSYRSVIAWWQVDLGTVYVVLSINITNRDAINNPENESEFLSSIWKAYHMINTIYIQISPLFSVDNLPSS